MLDQHLGRFGGPIATILIMVVAVAALVWFGNIIVKGIAPGWDGFFPSGPGKKRRPRVFAATVSTIVVVVLVMAYWPRPKAISAPLAPVPARGFAPVAAPTTNAPTNAVAPTPPSAAAQGSSKSRRPPKRGGGGSDNTFVGRVDPGVAARLARGSRNTIAGPTDDRRNTMFVGGTAIGAGATADQSSVAIGSGAHAGRQPAPGCPPLMEFGPSSHDNHLEGTYVQSRCGGILDNGHHETYTNTILERPAP